MSNYKRQLIEHAKLEPLASQYSTLAAYNDAYMAWHDKYVSLMAIAAKQTRGYKMKRFTIRAGKKDERYILSNGDTLQFVLLDNGNYLAQRHGKLPMMRQNITPVAAQKILDKLLNKL